MSLLQNLTLKIHFEKVLIAKTRMTSCPALPGTVPEDGVSHYFLMLPLSFLTNYDGTCIPVLKQNANCAIILAKLLSYAPGAGFPHFLETSTSSCWPILPCS